MKNKHAYKKIRGCRTRNIIGGNTYTLYEAKDHLLQVKTLGYTESYQRFYFKDIKAIVAVRTAGWVWKALLWLLIALFQTGGLVATWGGTVGPIIFGSFAALFYGLFMAQLIQGPSCQVELVTNLGPSTLGAFKRIKKLRKKWPYLKTIIVAQQPQLEELENTGRLTNQVSLVDRVEGLQLVSSSPSKSWFSRTGRIGIWLSGLACFLSASGLFMLPLVSSAESGTLVSVLFTMIYTGLGLVMAGSVMVLSDLPNQGLFKGFKWFHLIQVLIAVVGIVLTYVIHMVFYIFAAMAEIEPSNEAPAFFTWFEKGLVEFTLGSVFTLCGFVGFTLYNRLKAKHHTRQTTPPPVPPSLDTNTSISLDPPSV